MFENEKLSLIKPDKNIFFLPLFLSIIFIRWWLIQTSIELSEFKDAIISIATIEQVDISKRVGVLYQGLLFVSIVFLAISYACNLLIQKNRPLSSLLFGPLNILSALGCFALLFQWMQSGTDFSVNLVGILMLCSLSLSIAIYFLKLKVDDYAVFFSWISCLALSISFLFVQLLLVTLHHPSFLLLYFLSFLFLLVVFLMVGKYRNDHNGYLYRLQPLIFIPILCFISNEIYLILNQHGINALSPGKYYLIFLTGIVISILLLHKKYDSSLPFKSARRLFYMAFPLVLISIGCISHYAAIIDQPGEMFELANPANGLMRWFEFGELPVLQAFSSHLLSEQAFGFLYATLNGYDGTVSFLAYDFINQLIFLVIAYFFIYKLFDNAFFGFLFALFFPFIQVVVDATHIMAIITLFMLFRLFNKYSFYRMLLLMSWTLFLLVWRLDVGVANFITMNIILVLYFIFSPNKKHLFDYLKAWLFAGMPVLLAVIAIVVIKDIDLISHMQQALSYSGAAQAHGNTQLSHVFDRYYYYHYFAFPLIMLGILIFIFFRGSDEIRNKYVSLLYLSLLFLSIYYFANAQRGLIRHSLVEGQDMFLSSFAFLIMSLFPIYLFKRKDVNFLLLFTLLATVIMHNFKFPDSTGYGSYSDHFGEKQNTPVMVKPSKEKISRLRGWEDFSSLNVKTFKDFIDANFSKEATFLDFSNTPMLYYYTKRRVPSYFNQYMQNTATPSLQKENISLLNKLDIPLVVFSHYPAEWWDKTDGVPNTLRYYLITEHIYNNYNPYGIVGKYYVWIKKGMTLSADLPTDLTFVYGKVKEDFKKLPYIIGTDNNLFDISFIHTWTGIESNENTYSLDLKGLPTSTGNFFRFELDNQESSPSKAILIFGRNNIAGGEIAFDVLTGAAIYDIPVGWQYNWVRENNEYAQIIFQNAQGIKVKKISLLKRTYNP